MSLVLLTAALAPAPEAAPAPPAPLVQDEAPAAPHWQGSVNAGANFTNGNSEVTTVNVNADAERKGEDDRWSGRFFYNLTEEGSPTDTTQDNAGAQLQYDYYVNDRLYWLASGDYFTDDIATLDSRTIAGLGAGYQLKQTETLDWRGEAGLNWVNEDFAGTPREDYYAVRVASVIGWDINERVRLENDSEFLPSIDDGDDMTARSDTRLNISLSDSMQATIQYVFVWDNTPAAGVERDDHRLVFTVGWTFGK